jgi:antitoxin (DNA-binding transcriptional repressor) of toxin-antitoxin stability system
LTTVGIRNLKAHLSRHLKRVQAGVQLRVTDRGRTIATISPAVAPASTAWAHQLVAEGRARWNGGKPVGVRTPVKLRSATKTVSEAVLEDRR